jgi:hypothetical protein
VYESTVNVFELGRNAQASVFAGTAKMNQETEERVIPSYKRATPAMNGTNLWRLSNSTILTLRVVPLFVASGNLIALHPIASERMKPVRE